MENEAEALMNFARRYVAALLHECGVSLICVESWGGFLHIKR